MMLKPAYPYYLANQAVYANQDLVVSDKYTGEIATRVALADASVIDQALTAATQAQHGMARLAAYERQQGLQHCIEAGKPIKDAGGEVFNRYL